MKTRFLPCFIAMVVLLSGCATSKMSRHIEREEIRLARLEQRPHPLIKMNYLWTVPVDIVTFPVMFLFYLQDQGVYVSPGF